ncbi:unnamed protein product [Arabidopsis halleri]
MLGRRRLMTKRFRLLIHRVAVLFPAIDTWSWMEPRYHFFSIKQCCKAHVGLKMFLVISMFVGLLVLAHV